MGQIEAYGVLTTKAFTLDAMAARRATAENNFIAGRRGVGGEGDELHQTSRQAVFIAPPPISEATTTGTPDTGCETRRHWRLMDVRSYFWSIACN